MSYRCLRASQAARRPPAPHWASTAGPRRGPAATGCAPAEGSPASYPPALVRTALLPRLLDAVRLRPVPLALPAAAAAAAAGSSAAAQRRRAAALHSAARIGAGSGSGTTCGPAVRTRGVCYVHTTAVSLSSSSAQQLRAAVASPRTTRVGQSQYPCPVTGRRARAAERRGCACEASERASQQRGDCFVRVRRACLLCAAASAAVRARRWRGSRVPAGESDGQIPRVPAAARGEGWRGDARAGRR